MKIVLFEPEIPQNTGSIIRSASCFGFDVNLIEPFGFIFSDKKLQRSSMDYAHDLELSIFSSWADFLKRKSPGRLVLLTPHTQMMHHNFTYHPTDHLIMGRESSGVPDYVANECDAQLRIPMLADKRSLNLAVSAGIVMCEMSHRLGFVS